MPTYTMLMSIILSITVTGCGEVAVQGDGMPAVDANLGEVTLSQANSEAVTTTVGCSREPGHLVNESSFYRALNLSDFGVPGALHLTRATFGVFGATAGQDASSQPVEIRIYDYSASPDGKTLDFELMRMRNRTPIRFDVPDTSIPRTFDVPLDVDIDVAVDVIVAELWIPSGVAAMNQFDIGANLQGERDVSYLRAPQCEVDAPTSLQMVGLDRDDYVVVFSVSGDPR